MIKLGDPTKFVGCYTLHLYCDCPHPDNPTYMQEFTGRTFSQCSAAARRAGWQMHMEKKTATCPAHAKHQRNLAKSFGQERRNMMKMLYMVAWSSGISIASLGPLTMPLDKCWEAAAHRTMAAVAYPEEKLTFTCEYISRKKSRSLTPH